MKKTAAYDFAPLHAAMQRQVDLEFLPGVATAVLVKGEVVDEFRTGWADREARIPLGPEHIYRMYSSTKLVTSCAALMLWEGDHFDLDEPVEFFIPQFAKRRVLRPGATHIDDTEAARGPITIRHLLTHTSGMSYGVFDPGSLLFKAYNDSKVLWPDTTLAQKMDLLAPLPLAFHPGEDWEYSFATDVIARLIEVVSGRTFGDFLSERIFAPLGMTDTGFHVPADKHHRLCAYYAGVDTLDPTKPGLGRCDHLPYPGAYLKPMPSQSGGGGLVSTMADNIRLIRSLMPGNDALLRPATVAMMARNHLAEGQHVKLPMLGRFDHLGFGLGSAAVIAAGPDDPRDIVGEFGWAGLAGTHWWINPRTDIAGILLTQRYRGAMNPFSHEFRRLAYHGAGLQ